MKSDKRPSNSPKRAAPSTASAVDQEKRVLSLFQELLQVPDSERQTWIQSVAGTDSALQDRLNLLLKSASDSTDMLLTGGAGRQIQSSQVPSQIGPYKIIEQIGAGGMGTVYRAERADGNYERTVAIKLLSDGEFSAHMQARFANERQILAAMQHPNVAQLIDGGIQNEFTYIVMEYVDGITFDYAPNRPLSQTLTLFQKVCDAVGFAHNRLILHRDIKPDNVLLADTGEPKLLDFGIAKLDQTLAANEQSELTGVAPAPLTINYSSLERLQGEPATIASDIYSLGVYLYELVHGNKPYDLRGLTLPEALHTLEQQLTAQQAITQAKTSDIDTIIRTCMHPDVGRRYASAAALSEDIDRLLNNRPILARADDWRYLASRFARRYRGVLVGATLGLTLLMAALVYSLWQTEKAQIANGQSQAIASFLESTLLAPDPFSGSALGPDSTLVDLMRSAETQLEWEFDDQPEIRIRLAQLLSRVYLSLNLADDAQTMSDTAAQALALSGIQDPILTLGQSTLAINTAVQRGSLEQAASNCEHALAQAEHQTLPPAQTTELLLVLYTACGNAFANSGKLDRVRPLLGRAAALIGKHSQHIARHQIPKAYSALANAYGSFGDDYDYTEMVDRGLVAAEDLGESGLAAMSELLLLKSIPPNQVGDSKTSLEFTTLAMDAANRSKLARNGANYAYVALYHADRLIDVGDLDAAESTFGPVRGVLYGDTPDASALRSLAHFTDYKLAYKQRNFAAAEQHLVQSRKIRMDAGETNTQWLAATDHALGKVYIEMSRFVEAEALIQNAYDFYRKLLGEDHQRVQVYKGNLERAQQAIREQDL